MGGIETGAFYSLHCCYCITKLLLCMSYQPVHQTWLVGFDGKRGRYWETLGRVRKFYCLGNNDDVSLAMEPSSLSLLPTIITPLYAPTMDSTRWHFLSYIQRTGTIEWIRERGIYGTWIAFARRKWFDLYNPVALLPPSRFVINIQVLIAGSTARFRTRHHCTTGRFSFNKSSIYCQPSLKAEGKREWPADQSSQWPLETKEYGAPSQTPFPAQRQQVLELDQISRRGTEYKGKMCGSVVTDYSHMFEHLKDWRKQIKVTWVHLDKILSTLFHT